MGMQNNQAVLNPRGSELKSHNLSAENEFLTKEQRDEKIGTENGAGDRPEGDAPDLEMQPLQPAAGR